jgi:hypothetical protein
MQVLAAHMVCTVYNLVYYCATLAPSLPHHCNRHLIIAAGGPASVGLAYKHQAVLALMLFQLYFMLA